jgi:hypothetical protein
MIEGNFHVERIGSGFEANNPADAVLSLRIFCSDSRKKIRDETSCDATLVYKPKEHRASAELLFVWRLRDTPSPKLGDASLTKVSSLSCFSPALVSVELCTPELGL